MNTRQIFLAFPLDKGLPDLLRQIPESGKFHWAYLGSDYRQILELEKGALKQWPRISISEKLQVTAGDYRSQYIEWIGEMGQERNSLPWWAGSISDKCPYTSSLFLHICYLKIALELIEEYGESGLLLVIESAGLFRQISREAGTLCRNQIQENLVKKLFNRIDFIFQTVRFYLHYLVRIARELRLAHQTRRPGKIESGSGPEVLLITYADEKTLLPDGRYADRYFGCLPAWLTENGYRITWMPYIYRWPEKWSLAVERIRGSSERMILMQDYLRFRDYLSAIFHTVIHYSSPRNCKLTFSGLPVYDILHEHLRESLFGRFVIDRLVFLPFVKRLSRERPDISLIIYPYENRSWEKILCFGAHRFFSRATLIGFQHTTVNSMLLNYFPTPFEWSGGGMPDRVVCGGQEFMDLFLGEGYPPERLKLGSSLRYSNLNDMLKSELRPRDGSGKKRRILVLFPVNLSEITELFYSITQAFRTSDEFEILLKFHPAYLSADKLMALLPAADNLPAHFKIISGSLPEWLTQSDLFIYTTSSAVFEALALGIPVLKLVPETEIDLDGVNLNKYDHPLVLSTTAAGLFYKAKELLDIPESDRVRYTVLGRKIIQRIFNPVTSAGLKAFLPDTRDSNKDAGQHVLTGGTNGLPQENT